MKHNNICIIGIPGEEKEQGIENLFEKIITENFLNLERGKAMQVQEAQRIPIRINPKRATPRHIRIKMSTFKARESLKGGKEETDRNIQGSSDKASS